VLIVKRGLLPRARGGKGDMWRRHGSSSATSEMERLRERLLNVGRRDGEGLPSMASLLLLVRFSQGFSFLLGHLYSET
jgi:hypothetical protein